MFETRQKKQFLPLDRESLSNPFGVSSFGPYDNKSSKRKEMDGNEERKKGVNAVI
jgi:hypothetical protein